MRDSVAAALAAGLLLAAPTPPTAHAIIVGTTDDFQDGTVQGWAGGTNRVNTPGGQGGPSDLYLRVNTTTGGGSGSHLAFHSGEGRWLGDYAGAGVTAIEADIRNFGTTTVTMRLVLFYLGSRWTSTTGVVLPAGGQWTRATFPVSQSGMVLVFSSQTYANMIHNVDHIMIRHDVTPSQGGDPITAVIGVDNIRAVPAPGAAAALGAAGLAAGRRRRR